eukprot:3610769-Pyramimonas_sp.AAC.1
MSLEILTRPFYLGSVLEIKFCGCACLELLGVKPKVELILGCLLRVQELLGERSGRVRESGRSEADEVPRCGLSLGDGEAVVDTAAQSGLIGTEALQQLASALKQRGLRFKWVNKPARAQGVGGKPRTVGVIVTPFGIEGAHGLLELTVVE